MVCVVWALLWVAGCYAAWIGKGCRPFMPFLSDFDTMMPESMIFTAGASLQGMLMAVLLLGFQHHQRSHLTWAGASPRWQRLHHMSFWPGLIAAASCTGLAWAPWNTLTVLHRIFAYGIFFGGLLWGACSAMVTWRLARGRAAYTRYLHARLALSVIALTMLTSMSAISWRVFSAPEFDHARYVARSLDAEDFCRFPFDPVLNGAAACEWGLLAALIGVIWTLRGDLLAHP